MLDGISSQFSYSVWQFYLHLLQSICDVEMRRKAFLFCICSTNLQYWVIRIYRAVFQAVHALYSLYSSRFNLSINKIHTQAGMQPWGQYRYVRGMPRSIENFSGNYVARRLTVCRYCLIDWFLCVDKYPYAHIIDDIVALYGMSKNSCKNDTNLRISMALRKHDYIKRMSK